MHPSAVINWKLTGVIDVLAKDHLAILLDLRGHGRLDKPELPGAYFLEVVEDAVLFFDHLRIEQVHIVG